MCDVMRVHATDDLVLTCARKLAVKPAFIVYRIGFGTGGSGGGLGPLTFLFEGPNITVAPSLLKNVAPSLS